MYSHAVTIYDLIKPRSLWLELVVLVGFNLLLVACSYVAFELPFSPVPITGQTFGVLLTGMALGRTRGSGVVLAYLAEGALGVPVFAAGRAGFPVLMGPTGGYLIGFLVAAYLVGWLAEKGWDRTIVRSVFAMLIGYSVIFACGIILLSRFVPISGVLALGFWPFLPGMVVKIALAAYILPLVWKQLGRTDQLPG